MTPPATRARQARMPMTCERQRRLVSAIINSSCCSPAYRRDRQIVGFKVKMPDCICADATGSIVAGSLTGPRHRKKATFGGSIMTAQPTPKGAWRITFLLFLFMLVNFADKIVVGLAGVPIMTELKLEPEQFGLLGSSFFFLFSIAAIIVGFIVNRVAARWVLLALALIWALAQLPMVGTVGFTTLLICRVILGAGAGPAFSVAAHAIYKWFPDEKRTLPTAILSQGSAFGVILAVPALNWVIVNYSWHYAFGALGVVGLMWVVLWLFLGKEGPLVQTVAMAAAEPRIPYFRLLTSPTFIGCCAATFGAYWALSLGLTWFTPFIVEGLGFSQTNAGLVSILPWVFGAAVVLLTGWISQVMLTRGFSPRGARGVLGSVPLIIGGLIL